MYSSLELKFQILNGLERCTSPCASLSVKKPTASHNSRAQTSHMALRIAVRRSFPPPRLSHFRLHLRHYQKALLPDLPYDYSALEPVISGEIMELHHQKHHHTYVSNYNKALEQLDQAMSIGDAASIVQLQSALKFNGGGHLNHSIFWQNLIPSKDGGGEPPAGSLGGNIESQFGSLEALIQKMNMEGSALQGFGWVWLAFNKAQNRLAIETTMNQDPLVSKAADLVPLLGIDVWEHAYYLQYKNVKADYLKNTWKVMNWKYASGMYENECGQ